jgi:hypothetical protein
MVVLENTIHACVCRNHSINNTCKPDKNKACKDAPDPYMNEGSEHSSIFTRATSIGSKREDNIDASYMHAGPPTPSCSIVHADLRHAKQQYCCRIWSALVPVVINH